jgi:hypothetical protein
MALPEFAGNTFLAHPTAERLATPKAAPIKLRRLISFITIYCIWVYYLKLFKNVSKKLVYLIYGTYLAGTFYQCLFSNTGS